MRYSDKTPTRREWEASSNTLCALPNRQENRLWPLDIDSGPQRHTEKQNRKKKNQLCRKRKSREHEERSEKAEAESRLCLGQSRTVDRADASQAATCGVCRGRRQQQAAFGSPVARCPAVQVTVCPARHACHGNPGTGDFSNHKTSTTHPSLVGSTPRKGYASCAIFLPPQKPSDRHLVPCTSHTSQESVFFRG